MAGIDVRSSQYPGYVVVALRGEVDISNATRLARALSAAVATGSRTIVDLAGLTFMDCSSLHVLVSARQQALQAGGDLLLAAPQQQVLRLLCLAELNGWLPVLASAEEAANGDRRPRRPSARLLNRRTAKRRQITEKLTPAGAKHHRPGAIPCTGDMHEDSRPS